MDYSRIYTQLITRAQSRNLCEQYTEQHHIIPRCMNGDDAPSNLVDLLPEEHLIAHLLLVKMYPQHHRLVYAANMMCSRVHNNKEYGWVRRQFVLTEKINKTGVPRSLESRQKQSETVKRKMNAEGYVHPSKGKSLSQEHKAAVAAGNKGKHVPVRSRSSIEGYILRHGPYGRTSIVREKQYTQERFNAGILYC